MMKAAKASVRFQNTPLVLGAKEEALLDALQFDESSMASSTRSATNMEASFMSEGRVNRLNYVGRTPHAKVIESEQNRRKLEVMMNYMPSPVQQSPMVNQQSPHSDISYSPYVVGSTPLQVAELSNQEVTEEETPTREEFNCSIKTSTSSESSFNIIASNAERIIDSMPNASAPPSRSKPVVDSHRPPLSNIGNKLTSPCPRTTAEKANLSKAVSFQMSSERKPKSKAPVTPFVRANISSDESQIADENRAPDTPMAPNSSTSKQLFASSGEKAPMSTATVASTLIEEPKVDTPAAIVETKERQIEFIFLQAPKPETKDVATNYSPQVSCSMANPSPVVANNTSGATLKQNIIVSVNSFSESYPQQLPMAKLNTFSPATTLHMEGGVSFGKGPVMACFQSRKADFQSKQNSAVDAMSATPKCNATQCAAAELLPAKFDRSPKNTRKVNPQTYRRDAASVKSLISIPEEKEVFEFEAGSLDDPTSVYIDEQDGLVDEESTFAQIADYQADLYAIEHLSATSELSSPRLPLAAQVIDVSVQVDSKLFSSTKSDKKKKSKDMVMQTSFSHFERSPSYSTSVTTPQQSHFSASFLPSASDYTPSAADAEVSSNVDESYALIDLLPPKFGKSFSTVVTGNDPVNYKMKSVSNPWCNLPFDSTVCSAGGSASKSTVEMSNMFLANLSTCSKSSSLGKPRRILVGLNNEDYEHEERSEDEVSYQSLSLSEQSCSKVQKLQDDITLQTDIAVAQYSQEMLQEEDMISLRSALSGGANTTFTLDQSFMTKTTLSALDTFGHNKEVVPRFVIKSLKRTPDYPFEVKEINFDTAPGEFTTVMMVFNNHRSHPVTLNCSTVLVRLEPTVDDDDVNDPSQSWLMPTADAEFFTVTPPKLNIEGNSEGTLLVTFAPPPGMQGIFSGAMRIMHNYKSSIILLRGESSRGNTVKEQLLPSFYQDHSAAHQRAATQERDHEAPSPQATEASPSYVEQSLQELSEMKSPVSSPASIKQLFSEIKSSPTMNEYASKLRALHARIAEFGRRVAWKDRADSTPSTVGSESNHTKLITPECILIEQINDYCAINMENVSHRPIVIRISASNDIICPCYPQDDSKLICVSANSASRLLVRIDGQMLLNKVVAEGSIDCLCGNVILQYNSGEDCKVEVAVLLSRQLVDSIKAKAKQEQRVVIADTRQTHRSNDDEDVAALFQSTIRTTASMHELRSSRVSFQQQKEELIAMPPSEQASHRKQRVVRQNSERKDQRCYHATGPDGLYFEHQMVSFGAVRVGSYVRNKVRLCNATDREMLLFLGEPGQPFKIKHNQIVMRSRSIVHVPVSFYPTMEGDFASELIVQSEDGEEFAMVRLSGHASL